MTSSDFGSVFDSGNIQVIELHMLDLKKFLPLSLVSSLSIRALVYPFTLVKTRIQVQPKNGIYGRKTFRALFQIYSKEGVPGLYRGYVINSVQSISSVFYVTTYEKVRQIMLDEFDIQNNSVRAFIGGGCACAVSQLIMVPFDVISQHMMIFERHKPLNISANNYASTSSTSNSLDTLNLAKKLQKNPKLYLAPLIVKEIYRRDGAIKGFYRGYLASLMCYVPSSSLLWCFYHFFCEKIFLWTPLENHQVIQLMAAPASGFVVALITNPLDLFRCNLQVRGTGWWEAANRLYSHEGWSVFTKGLRTRLFLLPLSSFLFMGGYELVKRLSVRSEIKEKLLSQ